MAPDRPERGHTRLALRTQIRIDLRRMHATWRALRYPHQHDPHPAGGVWTPPSRVGLLGYRLWSAAGAVAVALLYPLVLAGVVVRYYGRRLYRVAAALGSRDLLFLTAGLWGVLTVAVYLLAFPTEGVVAVAAGGSVAAVSAVLALTFARWDGRTATALVASPFAVTALFLPPVVAALYSQTLAAWVFPTSDLLAVWLLDGPLAVGGVGAALRAHFDLVGLAYVGMWFALAVPVGWALGLLAALADAVRTGRTSRR